MKALRTILTAFVFAFCVYAWPALAEKAIVDLDKLSPAVADQIRAAEKNGEGAVALNSSVASHAEKQQGWIDWFSGLDGGLQALIIIGLIIFVGIFGVWGLIALNVADVI